MQSLMDELRADQGKATQCAVCLWIGTRPKAEQTEWHEAMKQHPTVITHASIHRAIARRIDEAGTAYVGPAVGRGSVENHRNNSHGAKP